MNVPGVILGCEANIIMILSHLQIYLYFGTKGFLFFGVVQLQNLKNKLAQMSCGAKESFFG